MRQISIISLLLVSSLGFNHCIFSQSLKAKDVEGLWYGNYYLTTGTNYELIVEIKALRKSQVEVQLYYPSYFNSKYKAIGVINQDSVLIGSTSVTQGVGNFLVDYDDQMLLAFDGSTLKGTYLVNGEIFADVSLENESVIDENQRSVYRNLINESNQKFGQSLVGNELRLDIDSLSQVAIENVASFNNLNVSTMLIEGNVTAGGIEFPARMEFHMPESMYIELDFQGQKFLKVSNEVINWEYDPFNDELTIDSLSEETDNNKADNSYDNFIGTLASSIEGGFKISNVQKSFLNKMEAYRLTLEKDNEKRYFSIDPKTANLLRQEVAGKVNSYGNYQTFEGIPIPTSTTEFQSNGQVLEFTFDNFQFNISLDTNKLKIPEHLKGKIKPTNNPNAYTDKAGVYFNEGEYEEAKKYYELAIKSQGEAGWIYHRIGKCSHRLGSYYEAIGFYQKAISIDPEDAVYYNDMGLSKYDLGDYKNALIDFEKALSIDSNMAVTHSNKANSYYFLNEKEKAFESFSKAIELDSSNANFYANHGIVGVEVGIYSEARNSLKSAINLSYDNSAKMYNWIGISFYREEVYDSAVMYFTEAININDTQYNYVKNLAMAYYELDKMDKAQLYFEDALELNNEDDDLLNYLGLTFYNMGDYDGANYYFNKAITINSKNATYYDNRAYTYEQLGSYTKAIEDLTTSIQLYPDDAEVFYRRGLIYKLQHNNFNACQDFKKAAEMEHEEAEEAFKNCKISDG
ncbi:Tfp pilus assembly protein PilF [Ekhidna lutea]|uniref:Tfp pilus assembly protein PilF n=1 Tax=Ekhidna lutea TaxID=447679 RepID=A0A239IZX6_EKHLU|nr:tetratricopeptide repeat protein [Ekhidna lutea]SNS99130.1 Tfp pilus assembly protein PilF [Ekhidna lutea]